MHRHLIDPLLAPVGPLDADDGDIMSGGMDGLDGFDDAATDGGGDDGGRVPATPADGVAFGQPGFTEREPVDPAALWGRLRTHSLRIRLGSGDVRASLVRLLERWIAGIDPSTAGPGDRDSSLSVSVPSRDVRYVGPLQRHHFGPAAHLAVRVDRSGGAPSPPGPRPVPAIHGTVRAATEEDLPVLGRMAADLQRYDARFGSITVREGVVETLTAGVAEALREEPELTWVFEDGDGVLRGFTQLNSPAQGTWATAPCVDRDHTAYLGYQYVEPAARSAGIGSALVAVAHDEAARRGWSTVVLHYAAMNPLSSVFWPRQGYRPLMTAWFRSPAFAEAWRSTAST